jgi:protein-tyrosine kinase
MSVRSLLGQKLVNLPPPGAEELALRQEQPPDRLMGQILRESKGLTDVQFEQILAYQTKHHLRFGEAAVALRLATQEEVLWALSQQFRYPYSAASGLSAELVAAVDPFGSQAEAIRGIRSQLMLAARTGDQPKRPLAVLSPDVGDGKSYLAANLAISYSQLGASTVIIDADMRTPRQHQLFSISNESGLSGILSGRAQLNVILTVADLPNLFVLPVGTLPPNPLDLLQRPAFEELLQFLLTKFDHIVVDAPAAVHGADALVIAAKCDLALVIGRRGRTQMKAVDGLLGQVTRSGAGLAGVVINDH